MTQNNRVFLLHREGACLEYASLDAAVKALGQKWIDDNVASSFSQPHPALQDVTAKWVLRYADGRNVTWEEDEEVQAIFRYFHYGQLTHDHAPGPITGIGRRRHYRYFRHPKTISLARQAILVVKEDGEIPPRARRNAKNLPNAWDDYARSCFRDRNWKKFRKTRYK